MAQGWAFLCLLHRQKNGWHRILNSNASIYSGQTDIDLHSDGIFEFNYNKITQETIKITAWCKAQYTTYLKFPKVSNICVNVWCS